MDTRNTLEDVQTVSISERSVRRRLKEVGLMSYISIKAPQHQRHRRVVRLKFAKHHENWNDDEWLRFCLWMRGEAQI